MEKLGRLKERRDARTVKFGRYVPDDLDLYRAPDATTYAAKVHSWPMAYNDRCGCCTLSSLYHGDLLRAANSGQPPKMQEGDVLAAYKHLSGWNGVEGDPSDTGLVMLDVLKFARRQGWIKGFVRVDQHHSGHVRHAAAMMGGLYVGQDLPRTVFGRDVWAVRDPSLKGDSAIGSAGGHATHFCDYSPEWWPLVSWGGLRRATWAYTMTYVEEAWAVLSDNWIDKASKLAPPGFRLEELEADLAALGAA